MAGDELKKIGQEIGFQFTKAFGNFCLHMRIRHPNIILQPSKQVTGIAERSRIFREQFEYYHDRARKEFVGSSHPRLDCHKLAAIAILTVLKISPFEEWRGVYRNDNFINETFAIYLAHQIMFDVRLWDYSNKFQGSENVVLHYIRHATFPLPVFDELTPMHRFRLLLAHMDLDEESLVNNIRDLAYHCYLLDSRQRSLIDGQLRIISA